MAAGDVFSSLLIPINQFLKTIFNFFSARGPNPRVSASPDRFGFQIASHRSGTHPHRLRAPAGGAAACFQEDLPGLRVGRPYRSCGAIPPLSKSCYPETAWIAGMHDSLLRYIRSSGTT